MHSKAEGGQVMRGRGAGVVVESASSRFQPGEIVVGPLGWQDYSVHRATAEGLLALEHWRSEVRPVALALGVLGSAGITAFFGLTDVGQIKAGDTVVVSAAAGGVGSCAVQIAGALDCRVVGIAGGKQKCHWLTERLKADAAINYQSGDLGASLDQACPHGIDVFFDNVGGEQLQLALERLALGARVVICGFISTDYERPDFGPSNYTYLLKRRARMEGFFVFDYQGRFHEAEAQLLDWYQAGRLTDTSDLLFGLENMPLALQSLFSGGNCGVRICQVSPDP